ncbi:hypothetical protein IWQ57_001008 [Coemansia nantahalensis]|uniref:Uncharacterized protein n=1 Tax=Coemansia nantahalensis TaxID=2789366 RepID=A0ACC1K6K7_9FUNG|nr:hypothetical protein IWQ57_001008 [Coemansia nantahalensis]
MFCGYKAPGCDKPQPGHDSDPLPPTARVAGKRVAIGGDFLETSNKGGFIVDKTLTCKALLESPDRVVRICLPWGFGKSFNLSVIAQFFNTVTAKDCLSDTENPDLNAALERRRKLFCGSLLEQHHPEFVERHFATIPAIQIDFKVSFGKSLGSFYASLASAIYSAATFWVNAYAVPELLKGRARAKYEALEDTYSTMRTYLRKENDSQWEARGGLAYGLFSDLSEFLVAQHGSKYIILVDEYDQPLKAALGQTWQADADDAYLGMLMEMFKGNDHLAKGLLVGVHEFKLSDRESGLNSAKELSLTTGRYRGGKAGADDIGDESPGPLAALFAFTREDLAELTKRTREVSKRTRCYSQEHIMEVIETWCGGYDFGFPTKRYNPLSVLKFLEALANGDIIEAAAATYWVDTGNVASIAQLARDHCEEILRLAPRLLHDYRTGAEDSSIRVAGQDGKAECVLPSGDFQRVNIGRTIYPSSCTDLCSTDELATLLLHLGYLTMRPGNGLHIPNGEMNAMWRMAVANFLFAANSAAACSSFPTMVIEQLDEGDITGITELMKDVTRALPKVNKKSYQEMSYADMFRVGLDLVLGRNPAVTITSEPETSSGKANVVIMLTPRNRRRLVVIIEMKRIKEADAKTRAGARAKAKELASAALEQITERGYAQRHEGFSLRLDIGMAVGKYNVVQSYGRWWIWSTDKAHPHGKPKWIRSTPLFERREGKMEASFGGDDGKAEADAWGAVLPYLGNF